MVFDPSDAEQDLRLAGGREQRRKDVTAFVEGLIEGGPGAVADAIARVSERARLVLVPYAHHMAELAVSRRESRLLVYGLVANVVAGLDINNPESLRVMALIDDAARRLGVALPDLFDEVAVIVGGPGADSLARWLNREPKNRSLAAMAYIVVEEDGEVIYVSDWA